MRIHCLRITAFGPFPGTELVDVDALSTSGLFLLHGPTGAGKTSVLDAICFALYGRVPGARGTVTRLRSDHADPAVAPEVACEFSIGERRFEITRSPAWERPKKRATGTTTEQARVVVRERDGQDWRTLTSRADEAGHLVDSLLGLGLDQFTKLVLLPQGEFAAFLRADAEDRRRMLERLFATDRFTAVQQWMQQRQRELRREVEAAEEVTREIVARARQAVAPLALGEDQPAPTGQQAAPDGSEDPAAELAALERAARQAWEDATANRLGTTARLQQASAQYHQGEQVLGRRQEHARASARRAALLAVAGEQEERRRRIEQAVRAEGLLAVADTLRAATDRAVAAQGRLTAAADHARDCSPLEPADTAAALADPDGLESAAARARQAIAELAQAERDARRLSEAETELAARETARGRAEGRATELRDTTARLEAELAQLRLDRDAASVVAARVEDLEVALAAAEAVVAAVERRTTLRAQVAAGEQARDEARRRRDDLRETWLDLRERRLAGIAAELAADLVTDRPCPVCGSCAHPAPATGGAADPVDAATERACQQQVHAAEQELEASQAVLGVLTRELAAVTEQAGDRDAMAAAQQREQTLAAVGTARDARSRATSADARLEVLTGALAAARTDREAAEDDLRAATAAAAAAEETTVHLRERLGVRAVDADCDLAARRDGLQAWAQALTVVATARQEVVAAGSVRDDALAAADRAATAAGFPTLREALAAVTDPQALAELRARARDHDEELAALEHRLADPELAAAAATPAPSLAALQAAQEDARSEDEAAARKLAVGETAVTALGGLLARLRTHLTAGAPVVERYRTAEQLSRCLDGTGGDNTRRMSLSAYVLAARLEQVAAAASERLTAMSGGRYSLVHSDDLERGRVRSGLSLRVVDEWTGAQRETSSLSGGESFYTSLALALGLADVVTAESGGAAVETLFVDEGFGSLDEDTLDEVMDVLDTLRNGGRAVGLVSHVADLRQRIPSRLEVVKTRAGSRLRAAAR